MSSEPKKKPVTRLRARTTDTPRALDFDTLLVENARKIVGFREYIKEMWHRRGLVRVLAGRQLKSQYELNVVGFAWWLAEPLSLAAVYYVLVAVLTKRQDHVYILVVLISLLSFKWFQQSVIQSMNTVRGNASLVTDIYFPRALLPITETMIGLAHFGVGLCIVPIFMLFLGVGPTPNLIWLPVIVAVQLIFNLGAAYPMAVWGLRYRNLPNLMGNIIRLWFYLSPALYELTRFSNGTVKFIMELNPLTGLFESYRRAFALAGFMPTKDCPRCKAVPHYFAGAPHPALLWTFVLGCVMLVLGAWYFTRKETQFGKEI